MQNMRSNSFPITRPSRCEGGNFAETAKELQADAWGGKKSSQRGMTLVDFMVGLTIGLLVILASVASLLIVRGSSRTMTDSAALEQQATLAMLQIGRQISQTGAYNACLSGSDCNQGVNGAKASYTVLGGGSALMEFDSRRIGVSIDNGTTPLSTLAVFGIDGTSTTTDTLYISYALSNDASPSSGCAGLPAKIIDAAGTGYAADGARRAVSVFTVNPTTRSLTCDTDPAGAAPIPIAGNVIDMRVKYLSVAANGDVKYYKNAAAVNSVTSSTWNTINAVEVCLEMIGDITQAGQYTFDDCQGNSKTVNYTPVPDHTDINNDGRLHRVVRNTFYLRNPL